MVHTLGALEQPEITRDYARLRLWVPHSVFVVMRGRTASVIPRFTRDPASDPANRRVLRITLHSLKLPQGMAAPTHRRTTVLLVGQFWNDNPRP